ncbi:hypothetical protein [Streptomyces sp. NPDC051677]|uniref:hypothetical protein n=1 Tax=Streptomyces sp. NPDC051677 TaxID=3365669 RepID=UPI0037D63D21
MRRPGPALRVGLLGVAVTLTGYALFAAWLGLHLQRYADARDRATASAVGVVVEDDVDDEDDVRVRWTDAGGHAHVQRFGIYDTDRYTEGARFPVAYDADDPTPKGFPADGDETAAEDDLIFPVVLGGVVALLLTCVWVWRGLRFRLRVRRPGRPMTGRVLYGRRLASPWRDPRTTWLALTAPEDDRHWQRVMWHPALDELSGEVEVTVHRAGGTSLRPAAVTLPDGTRLVPLGKLRRHRPPFLSFDDHEAVRVDLEDAFVLPAGTLVPPARPWWRGAMTAASGTALGVLAGFVLTDGSVIAALAFALCAGTLLTSVWALSSPQP